jgi:hypothetical protein
MRLRVKHHRGKPSASAGARELIWSITLQNGFTIDLYRLSGPPNWETPAPQIAFRYNERNGSMHQIP